MLRNKQDFLASPSKPHTPVEIFAVHEVIFAQQPHIRENRASHEHERSGYRLHLSWMRGQRIMMEEETTKAQMKMGQPENLSTRTIASLHRARLEATGLA